MSKFRIIIIPIFISLFIISSSAVADPGLPDTVRVDSVSAYPSGQAILPIYFYNDEPLSGVSVVLRHDDDFFVFDSFSTVGGRLDGFPNLAIYINDSADLASFAAFENFSATEDIPEGNGLLCKLFLSVDASAAGMTFPIDSATWFLEGSGRKYTFFSDASAVTIKPQFEKGHITVLNAPPTNDTVWVDSIGGKPGEQVAVGVYGSNQEDLTRVDITLSYSSAYLTYNSSTFDQSRSQAAQKVVEANHSSRHIHIGLDFGDDTPLLPGRGLLATVLFDVSPSAVDETVIIDSTSYLIPEGQPLEFHQTPNVGGLSFAPYFERGFVDIKTAVAVEFDNHDELPTSYSLAQNTPNPFNPRTLIKFDLPKAGHVRLTVYNILGQTVRILNDQKLPAGRHSIIFDGKDKDDTELASGIYFYRLESGDFTQSKKMILLK